MRCHVESVASVAVTRDCCGFLMFTTKGPSNVSLVIWSKPEAASSMSKHETGNTNTETVQTVQCTVCSWIVGLLDVNIVIVIRLIYSCMIRNSFVQKKHTAEEDAL